jgi:hypothetical protein
MPNTAINNIKPDNAFQEKNHRVIYDINYEKSLKIILNQIFILVIK